jgi:hypothetical protein
MTRAIKLQARAAELPERKVRLRLPGPLVVDLELYARLYFEEHGHEIELPDLLLAIVEQFLSSDRGFGRQKRGGAGVSQPAVRDAHTENGQG